MTLGIAMSVVACESKATNECKHRNTWNYSSRGEWAHACELCCGSHSGYKRNASSNDECSCASK